jgi:hypothetical protein
MVLTVSFVISPVIGRYVTVAGAIAEAIVANVMPASRHQDHTTSPSASPVFAKRLRRAKAPFVFRRLRVHRISPNVRDDGQRPSYRYETAWTLPVIWGNDQSRDLRRINTTGKSVEIEQFVSTEQQLLRVARVRTMTSQVGRSSECDCFFDHMFQRSPLSGQGHSQFKLTTLYLAPPH